MKIYPTGFISTVVSASLMLLPCLVNANDDARQYVELSAMFALELSKHGEIELTTNQEHCTSKIQPVHVNQEIAEILAKALEYSKTIKVKADCQKVPTEEDIQSCSFYFYSPNSVEQWTRGFTFLGNPNNGKINVDTIECFSTP